MYEIDLYANLFWKHDYNGKMDYVSDWIGVTIPGVAGWTITAAKHYYNYDAASDKFNGNEDVSLEGVAEGDGFDIYFETGTYGVRRYLVVTYTKDNENMPIIFDFTLSVDVRGATLTIRPKTVTLEELKQGVDFTLETDQHFPSLCRSEPPASCNSPVNRYNIK